MKLEEQVREDLHAALVPTVLVPPTDLADTVLQQVRRRRHTHTLLAAVTAVIAVAFGVPLALTHEGGSAARTDVGAIPGPGPERSKPTVAENPTRAAEPTFPIPGGGPQAIHVLTIDESKTYLLDPAAGRYREVPYQVVLSPDLRQVAVTTGDRTGVAERTAFLRDGETAIRWINLPPGNGPAWSPDGKALLFTSIGKGSGTVRFTAHRYDLATGAITDTPVPIDILGSSVGWAADSRRYVALLPGARTNDTVEPGALQYLDPDGTLGQRVEIQAGGVGGAESYSPSRKYMIVDASAIMSAQPVPSKILDTGTGRVVASMPAGSRPIGWYDEKTVARLASGSTENPVLELVDVGTGTVTKRIDLPGLPHPSRIQIASSAGLTGEAVKFGF